MAGRRKTLEAKLKTPKLELNIKKSKVEGYVARKVAADARKAVKKGLALDGAPLPRPEDGSRPLHQEGDLIKSIKPRKMRKDRGYQVGPNLKKHPRSKMHNRAVFASIAKAWGREDLLALDSSDVIRMIDRYASKWFSEVGKKRTDWDIT